MSRHPIVRMVVPVLIVVLAIGVFVLFVKSRPEPPSRPPAERSWRVNAETIELGVHAPTLVLYGLARSPSRASLVAAIEADVQKVFVDEGASVRSGQVLVQLDAREAELRLQQQQAVLAQIEAQIEAEHQRYATDQALLKSEQELLDLAGRNLQRIEQLKRNNLLSQTAVDQAREARVQRDLSVSGRQRDIADHPARLAQLKAQRAGIDTQIALARLDLQRARITAPFAGRITGVNVAPGRRVRNGEALIEIYDPSATEVRAQMPVNYLAGVRRALSAGTPLTATAEVDGQPVRLQLDRLASLVDAHRGGVDGFFRVIDGADALQIGRMVDLLLELPAVENSFSMPREALYGTDRVYRIVDGRLAAAPAKVLGEIRDLQAPGRLLIDGSGFISGDVVLTSKFANAMEGLRVEVVEATP